MKKILCILALIVALVCVLVSCDFLNQFEKVSSEISDGFFEATQGLAYKVNADGQTCTITGIGTCTDSHIYIGGHIDGYKITGIGNSAFKNCSNFTRITIGDSVTSIGEGAFRECSGLTSVTFVESTISIGDFAFYQCPNLESVTIGNASATIGSSVFSNCNPNLYTQYGYGKYVGDSTNPYAVLVEITREDLIIYEPHPDTKIIVCGVFHNFKSLTNITIPDGVRSIGPFAFQFCSKLRSVTIPDSVTIIGNAAFKDCINLTSVTIPDSVTTIGDQLFYNCYNLASVTIGDSVTTIGDSAFYRCYNLASVTIPDSVTTIGDSAFQHSSNLTKVYIYDIAAWCNIAFANYSANPLYYAKNLYLIKNDTHRLVTNLVIPQTVNAISAYAFSNCDNLTSVTIPDSVTAIGNFAFAYCSKLESVTIGDSVTTIGNSAFKNCSKLESVTFAKPNNWRGTRDVNGTSSTVIFADHLSDTFTAANYLRSYYSNYYWFRTQY